MQSVIAQILKTNLTSPSLRYLKGPAQGWQKPQNWPDIRKSATPAAIGINLLICNAYPNFGFKANCAGGYSVYVNGVKQGDYSSGAQCSLTLAALSGGVAINYPAPYTAHRVEIRPISAGANITVFTLQRVAANGYESQGLLWAHFNVDNPIDLYHAFFWYNQYTCPLIEAITAKNNTLYPLGLSASFSSAADYPSFKYLPVLDMQNAAVSTALIVMQSGSAREVVVKNITTAITSLQGMFQYNTALKSARFINCNFSAVANWSALHRDNRALVVLPAQYSYAAATDMTDFITNATALNDTALDVSAANSLTKIGCYGTAAYPMRGFKRLKVSASAPFSGAAPQINVGYTGMDRAALVALFNSLPTVSGGQVCVITGASGAAALNSADIQIATNKGWTITA